MRNGIVMLVLVAATAALLYALIQPAQASSQPYSQFRQDVQNGLVKEVDRQDTTLTVTKTNGNTYTTVDDNSLAGTGDVIAGWLTAAVGG